MENDLLYLRNLRSRGGGSSGGSSGGGSYGSRSSYYKSSSYTYSGIYKADKTSSKTSTIYELDNSPSSNIAIEPSVAVLAYSNLVNNDRSSYYYLSEPSIGKKTLGYQCTSHSECMSGCCQPLPGSSLKECSNCRPDELQYAQQLKDKGKTSVYIVIAVGGVCFCCLIGSFVKQCRDENKKKHKTMQEGSKRTI